MSNGQIATLLVVALSFLGVLTDAVLKLAGADPARFLSKWLFIGVALSCTFAVGWMFLMRLMKLAVAGVIYGVTSAVLLCVVGVVFFDETLSTTELAGIGTATLAIILLAVPK